jgi:hypothetical protein
VIRARWAQLAALLYSIANTQPAAAQSHPTPPPGEPDEDEVETPPPPARRADPEKESRPDSNVLWELAGIVSYLSPPIRGGASPFNAGFGVRTGFTFSNSLYLGGSFLSYLGDTDVDLSTSAMLFGGEVGWAFTVSDSVAGKLILRPQVTVGDALVAHTDPSLARVDIVTSASGRSSSSVSSSGTTRVNGLFVRPALQVMFVAGKQFFAFDGLMMVVPSITHGGDSAAAMWVSYGAQGELGFRF